MAISALFPTIWSARITYFAEQFSAFLPNANRLWEGEAIYGNVVKIPTIDRDVTIQDYNRDTDLVDPERIDAGMQDLLIDQEKYFHFALEDLDNRQSRISGGMLVDMKSQGAGLKVATTVDDYVASRLEQVYQRTGDANTGNAAAKLLARGTDLLFSNWDRTGNIPNFSLNFWPEVKERLTIEGLLHSAAVMVTTPELIRKIEEGYLDGSYGDLFRGAMINPVVNAQLASDPARANGLAMILSNGNRVYVSNSKRLRRKGGNGEDTALETGAGEADAGKLDRGNKSVMWIYNPFDLALVQQINQVEAYRPERRFSSAIKGLTNYGAKVLDAGDLENLGDANGARPKTGNPGSKTRVSRLIFRD